MPRIAALLRRYSTLLFLACIAVLGAVAAVQSVRLRYLEARHERMFAEFGKAQLAMQFKAGELKQQLDACRATAAPGAGATSTPR